MARMASLASAASRLAVAASVAAATTFAASAVCAAAPRIASAFVTRVRNVSRALVAFVLRLVAAAIS